MTRSEGAADALTGADRAAYARPGAGAALRLHYRLAGLGFRFAAAGDALYVMPSAALTDADRAAVREHKAALLGIVRFYEASAAIPRTVRCTRPSCETFIPGSLARGGRCVECLLLPVGMR